MIKFFLFFLFCLNLYAKEIPQKVQLLEPLETIKLLEEHQEYAIGIGDGETKVFAFIDPKCSMSQMYLKMLYAQDGRMLKKYTVYLFLLHLDGKHSEQEIETLLATDMPELSLKVIMLQNQALIYEAADDAILEKIEIIEEIAKKIGVYKRPYIIMEGKVIT
ncbi:MAG: hypothetical protein FP820_02560 [Sulfurimonas sp.]|nr:hypothetical protein [Sulfurimonas sp.]MBU4024132.1 hypothetical protein [bacterium]MBU4110835.1 hypothetical protein [bacterium]